ncbi:14989_t:CDS:2 [Racocetra fulgida]|uniref:14989_t:CDS:1 n=1 Tax=Racocetra fulgida TaxID=60492 RepID=A0A9N9B7M1_9GLOM|nr:14989_t:CDS:2 [Racocetra fulgida]
MSQIHKTNTFKIRYTDEDEDTITIDNDHDLREAIEHNRALSKDSPRLVIWLTLEELKPSLINKELPSLPDHSSSDTDPVPTSNESNASYNDFHEYLFESVLNPGIKNLQDIVQNIVTQVSNTFEKEFVRDSLDLSLRRSTQSQSSNIVESTQVTNDATNSSNSSKTSETRHVQTQESRASSALAPTQHPGHTFMKIHRAGDPEIKIPGIVICGNCLDFDLCGNCEANPISKHDENHVFIKIKKPVSQRLRTDKPLLHDFYSKVEQKTGRFKDCKQSSQSNNVHKEMESVPRQTSLVNSNSDASSSNPFIPLIRPINTEDSTEKVISRAPVDLYNYTLGAKPIVSSSSPEKLEKETIQTHTTQVTPSPPLSNVTTMISQDEVCDVPFKISVETLTEKRISAKFISDANVPDGTILAPQAQFRKMWIMSNDDDFGSVVGSLEPGKSVYVSVDLQAPTEPGKYTSLTDNEGNVFGHKIWCEINVEADDQSSSMSSSMIFPVLNYDQKLSQSASGSIQSPVSTAEDDDNAPLQNLVKPTVTELQTGIVDLESTSELNSELFNSDDDESDTSSIVSDSSQDFIVVDKDSDDDEMENSFINSEVRSSIPNSLVMSSCGDNTSVYDDFKDEPTEELKYQEEISKLAEMGFTDTETTYNLLLAYDGNIDKVIDSYLRWE